MLRNISPLIKCLIILYIPFLFFLLNWVINSPNLGSTGLYLDTGLIYIAIVTLLKFFSKKSVGQFSAVLTVIIGILIFILTYAMGALSCIDEESRCYITDITEVLLVVFFACSLFIQLRVGNKI